MSLVKATLKTVRHTLAGIEYEFAKCSYRGKAQVLADACKPHRETLVTDLKDAGVTGKESLAELRRLSALYDDEDDFERIVNGADFHYAFRHVLQKTYADATDADIDATLASVPHPEQVMIVAKAFNMVLSSPQGGPASRPTTTSPQNPETGTASEPGSQGSTPA
jgi:hypothetical protein